MITQSSTYNSHFANRTNDANLNQTENDCAHTEVNQLEAAWLQVDLGAEYSIRTVKIFYRDQRMLFNNLYHNIKFHVLLLFLSLILVYYIFIK